VNPVALGSGAIIGAGVLFSRVPPQAISPDRSWFDLSSSLQSAAFSIGQARFISGILRSTE
jgi:hypothetical protein